MEKKQRIREQIEKTQRRYTAACVELREARMACEAWDCDCGQLFCDCHPKVVEPPRSIEEQYDRIADEALGLYLDIQVLENELVALNEGKENCLRENTEKPRP